MLGKSFRSSHLRTQTGHKNSNKHQEKMLQARNKYIYEPKIYEDPYLVDIMSFLRDCCHLFFLLFFLLDFLCFCLLSQQKNMATCSKSSGSLMSLGIHLTIPVSPTSSSIFKRRTKGKREVLEDGVLPGEPQG